MSLDLFRTRADVEQIIQKEYTKAASGNGHYDWSLNTPIVRQARQDAKDGAREFLHGRLPERLFLTTLHIYFGAVYDETLRRFEQECEAMRPIPVDKPPVACDTVKLTFQDLWYINNRYADWFFSDDDYVPLNLMWDEKRGSLRPDDGFDNDIGEQDYSHIVLGEVTKGYTFMFGKHKGKTLEGVMRSDPDYLIWLKENTTKLDTVTAELWNEILVVRATHQEWRNERDYRNIVNY